MGSARTFADGVATRQLQQERAAPAEFRRIGWAQATAVAVYPSGPVAQMRPVRQSGNSTPVPRLTAASISTAVVSAIGFVKKRADRHSIVSSRALQASFAHLPTCCDQQFIEHLI